MKIDSFTGKYEFLSNFYEVPITYENVIWPTSEHAYQAMKTTSRIEQDMIRKLSSPGKAKRAGQQLKIRSDWDEVKDQIMFEIILAKFEQNIELMTWLVETGNAEIIEGNNWGDVYWGVDVELGGQNKLGKILMKIREILCLRLSMIN